jgi:hypothetical protein
VPPGSQGGVREAACGRRDLAEAERHEEAEVARRGTRQAMPRSGALCPRSLSARGGREHACRGKEDAVLGCQRRKKGGALACGHPCPSLPGWPRPPESCGGGAAWGSSREEKATMASLMSSAESTPPPG